jgi:hypothetical protein
MARNTTYKAPHYAVFTSLLFHPSQVQMFSQHPVLRHRQCSSLNVRDQIPDTHKIKVEIIVLYILIFAFLHSRQERKDNKLNGSKRLPNLISS